MGFSKMSGHAGFMSVLRSTESTLIQLDLSDGSEDISEQNIASGEDGASDFSESEGSDQPNKKFREHGATNNTGPQRRFTKPPSVHWSSGPCSLVLRSVPDSE